MRSHLAWVDLERTLSVLGVILIHVTSPLLATWSELNEAGRLGASLFNVAARFCVPVFFMASGYLLLARDEPVAAFFYRRAARVLVPLAAWSLIYAFWLAWLQGWILIPTYWLKTLVKIVAGVPVYYHLWFLYALVGIYLFVPILRHLVRTIDRRWLWYLAALWFVAAPVLLTVQSFTGRSTDYDLGYAGGYFGYFLLGHLLGSIEVSRAKARWAAVGWLAGIGVTVTLTMYLPADGGGFQGALVSYLSPQVAWMSMCAFLALRMQGMQATASFGRVLALLGQASFGIYLVHALVLDVIRETAFAGWIVLDASPWLSVPAQTLAIALASLAVVIVLRRIPGLRAIVP